MPGQLQQQPLCGPGFEKVEPPADDGIVEFALPARERESLFVECTDEIEAWARHALALNGFGDFL